MVVFGGNYEHDGFCRQVKASQRLAVLICAFGEGLALSRYLTRRLRGKPPSGRGVARSAGGRMRHRPFVYDGHLAPIVEADGYFDAIVPFRQLLGV